MTEPGGYAWNRSFQYVPKPLVVSSLSKDAEFKGDVVIDGTLTVKGVTTLESDTVVEGDLTVQGTLYTVDEIAVEDPLITLGLNLITDNRVGGVQIVTQKNATTAGLFRFPAALVSPPGKPTDPPQQDWFILGNQIASPASPPSDPSWAAVAGARGSLYAAGLRSDTISCGTGEVTVLTCNRIEESVIAPSGIDINCASGDLKLQTVSPYNTRVNCPSGNQFIVQTNDTNPMFVVNAFGSNVSYLPFVTNIVTSNGAVPMTITSGGSLLVDCISTFTLSSNSTSQYNASVHSFRVGSPLFEILKIQDEKEFFTPRVTVSGDLVAAPHSDPDVYRLGTISQRWDEVWTQDIDSSGIITAAEILPAATGNKSIGDVGNAFVQVHTTDVFTSKITSPGTSITTATNAVLPAVTSTTDIGSPSLRYDTIYCNNINTTGGGGGGPDAIALRYSNATQVGILSDEPLEFPVTTTLTNITANSPSLYTIQQAGTYRIRAQIWRRPLDIGQSYTELTISVNGVRQTRSRKTMSLGDEGDVSVEITLPLSVNDQIQARWIWDGVGPSCGDATDLSKMNKLTIYKL